jgi:hypothetical protein
MTCPYLSTPRLLPPVAPQWVKLENGYIGLVQPSHARERRQKALDAMFKAMARQGVGLWLMRWICPACGGLRPNEHRDGCEVVRQLGKV